MNRHGLPNFRGLRALIVHPPGDGIDILVDHLTRLGIAATCNWPIQELSAEGWDLIFFDADRGFDRQFCWEPGEAPIPLVALVGSEAPGRIEWMLAQMPSAYLFKPLRPNGIFSALVIAFHVFEQRAGLEHRIADLNARVRARPSVVTAINLVRTTLNVPSQDAYALLRTEAMKHQLSVESLCEQIDDSGSLIPLKRLADQVGERFPSKQRPKDSGRTIPSGGQ
jgi:AmiR/NasT family two-component response regulator